MGNQLQNPYTVANMHVAKDSLIAQGINGASSINVRIIKIYIRFLPQNISELDQIEEDLPNLVLFATPLDRKIERPATWYRAPGLSDSVPNPQYTVVDANFSYATVQWEKLDDIYIPEEDVQLTNDTLIKGMVYQSYTLTGNSEYLPARPKGWFDDIFDGWLDRWNPQGRIRVWDDALNGLIPVDGVPIRTASFTRIGITYTNSNGDYYESNNYLTQVHHSILWRRPNEFRIKDSFLANALYNGPVKKGDWNVDIGGASSSYRSMRYATMFRACHRYFNKYRGGLDDPDLWFTLNLIYKDESGSGFYQGNVPLPIWPNIKVWGKYGDGTFRKTENIFSTTLHEIGHASHWKKVGPLKMAKAGPLIRESWANAIEWHLTRIEYASWSAFTLEMYDETAEGIADWDQIWDGFKSDGHDKKYTPLFIDMVDEVNQSVTDYFPIYANLPNDQCPGDPFFDGANCYIGSAPSGTNGFIYNDTFYYSPIDCCDCPLPGSWFDGANCFVQAIPSGRIGFVYNNKWYLQPLGDPSYPYDALKNWSMAQIEDQIIPNAYIQNSVIPINPPWDDELDAARDAILDHLAPGITEKRVDTYLEFYYAL